MNLRFTVRFPKELLAQVKTEAAAREVSPSQLIKATLAEALAPEQQKTPAA